MKNIEYIKSSRLHPKKYTTIFGQFELKRYGYKPKIRDAKYNGDDNFYPLDVSANLPKRSYSYVLQEIVVLASNNQSFSQTSNFIQKIFALKLSVDAIEKITEESTMAFNKFYDELQPEDNNKQEITVVSVDGKGIPMTKKESVNIKSRLGKGEKKQKKKESLVSVCYQTTPIVRSALQVASSLILCEKYDDVEQFEKTDNILKVASLSKTKQESFLDLKKYSQKLGKDKTVVIVLDGARSLWSLAKSTFSDISFTGVLDIIHVRDYLYNSAHALYTEGSKDVREWAFQRCEAILNGNVKDVILELENKSKMLSKSKQKVLEKTITYFNNHLEYMKYNEYLAKGYPIASGVVESACSQVVANRCELPGARWSINGAEAILKHRSVYASNLWDDYWHYNKDFCQNANYSNCLEAVNGLADGFRMCG